MSTIHSLEVLCNELDAAIFMCDRPTIANIHDVLSSTVSPLLGMFPQSWDTVRY